MKYTVRYAHLERIPMWKPGDGIQKGRKVGRMGNTGQSTAPHLHIDCVEGEQLTNWRLTDTEKNLLQSAHKQLNWFIDDELFGTDIHITSYYNDPIYFHRFGKVHLAYDVVPENRHQTRDNWDIYWNRSAVGICLAVGHDRGYGNYILIGFEA